MVCHADYCLEKGEKKIRKILLRMCLVFPIFLGSLSLFYKDNMRDSVMCNGREELLLFNINNILEDISYDGSVINLPFHHPYKIFGLFMCKCVSNYKDANIRTMNHKIKKNEPLSWQVSRSRIVFVNEKFICWINQLWINVKLIKTNKSIGKLNRMRMIQSIKLDDEIKVG